MRWFYFVKSKNRVALWAQHYGTGPEADDAFYDCVRLFSPVPAILYDRGYPTEECADGGHEFHVSETHRFPREDHAIGDRFEVWHLFGIERFVPDLKLLRRQADANGLIAAVHQLDHFGFEGDHVRLTIEKIFVRDGALRQHQRRVREYDPRVGRSEEHTSELQSHSDLVCRLLLEKKKKKN